MQIYTLEPDCATEPGNDKLCVFKHSSLKAQQLPASKYFHIFCVINKWHSKIFLIYETLNWISYAKKEQRLKGRQEGTLCWNFIHN